MDLSEIEQWSRRLLEREARKRGVRTPEIHSQAELIKLILRHDYSAKNLRETAKIVVEAIDTAKDALRSSAGSIAAPRLPGKRVFSWERGVHERPHDPAAWQVHEDAEFREITAAGMPSPLGGAQAGADAEPARPEAGGGATLPPSEAPDVAVSARDAAPDSLEVRLDEAAARSGGPRATLAEASPEFDEEPDTGPLAPLGASAAAALPDARSAQQAARPWQPRSEAIESAQGAATARALPTQPGSSGQLPAAEEAFAAGTASFTSDSAAAVESSAPGASSGAVLRPSHEPLSPWSAEALKATAEAASAPPEPPLPDTPEYVTLGPHPRNNLRLRWRVSERGVERARAALGAPGELALRVVSVRVEPGAVVRAEVIDHGPVESEGDLLAPRSSDAVRHVTSIGLRTAGRFVSIAHVTE